MKKSNHSLEHEEKYIEFLKKKLASENWKSQATPEEIELTKKKFDKAKFKLKMMKLN